MSEKKLASLCFALALVYSISLPARAELLKNLKTDGSIETRSFGVDNLTDRNGTADDYRSETNVRFMLGANFDLLDDVHSRLLVDRRSNHGDTSTAGNNLNTIQSGLILDNAYVLIDKVFGAVDLTLGRQFYGNSNDLNIYFGPQNNDILSVTSVDLFRFDAKCPVTDTKFTGIAGKVTDTTIPGTNTDTTLYGGEASNPKILPKGDVAVYYYTAQTHAVKSGAIGNNTLNTAGARLMGDILAGLGYNAEYIQDFGRNNSTGGAPAYKGNAWFLNLHYGQDISGMPFRARAEYGRGSDDFAAIASERRFGLIWGEHSSTGPSSLTPTTTNGGNFVTGTTGTGLTNLRVFDAGVGINPIAKLGVDLNWYRFIYDEALSASGKTSAGTEYDLILSWKHSENVSFEVNAATFQVGDALQNAAPTGTSPITRLGADVKIKF